MTPRTILEIASIFCYGGERAIAFDQRLEIDREALVDFANAVIEADRESSNEPVAYLWKSYFKDTGKPIKLWLDRPEWPPGLGSPVPIVPVYTRPAPARKPLSEDEIRSIMLANGFTIKDGCEDLKPYVYAAVRAIEKAHGIGEEE